MQTQSQTNHLIRPYLPEDEAAVLNLLSLCLSSEASSWETPELWRWKHHANPFGPSYVLVAQASNGEVSGLRALMRWHLSWKGHTIYAARPVDTATHPDYRRGGLFTRLTREAMKDLQDAGVHLIFNTPNDQSFPGYLKMGWEALGALHTQVKIVNPARFAIRFASGLLRQHIGQIYPVSHVRSLPTVKALLEQPQLEALLQQRDEWDCYQLRTEASPAYLKWRYADHVSLAYRALWEERGGQMDGCLVLRPVFRRGLGGLIIEDMVLRKPDNAIVARLIRQTLKSYPADFLMAYFSPGSFQREALGRLGFREDVRKKINLVAKTLNPVEGFDPMQLSSWGVTMADLEFF